MFTGIIEGLGRITRIRDDRGGKRLTVTADFDLSGTRLGDSIAVNGACLTVVAMAGRSFEADVSPETVSRTTFGRSVVGERVNLERALRLGDRLDGHLVSGHIDGTARLAARHPAGPSTVVDFETDAGLTRYMIPKGSVAADGVSLTVNSCDDGGFSVSIIPHTGRLTTIGLKRIGEAVNIETDLIGKYVERLLPGSRNRSQPQKDGLDLDFLHKTGFL